MKATDKSQFSDFNLDPKPDVKTGRTRKTEKEEDEELLEADAEHQEEDTFSFEESPPCINLFNTRY